jgi:hypothetical protein
MPAYADLHDLEQRLRDESVLSVYIDGEETDPGKRRRWRIELKNRLDAIEDSLAERSHDEREAFRSARDALMKRLSDIRGLVRAPGWVGFFTAEGEAHAGPLPAAVSTLAVWERGPRLTPFVRALKEARPVILIVADSRAARLYRYAERRLEALETLEAEATIEPIYHMSKPPRPGFNPGTRGTPGTDVAQRELHDATMQMLAQTSERVAKLASNDAWIVVGGIPTVAAAALTRLPANLQERAMIADGLDVHDKKTALAEWARKCASALRDREDLTLVTEALDASASNGPGAAGKEETLRALEEGRARDVFFTRTFLERHADAASQALRAALGTSAAVEHVSGEAAERLDAAGGIAARLRYTLHASALQPQGTGA